MIEYIQKYLNTQFWPLSMKQKIVEERFLQLIHQGPDSSVHVLWKQSSLMMFHVVSVDNMYWKLGCGAMVMSLTLAEVAPGHCGAWHWVQQFFG